MKLSGNYGRNWPTLLNLHKRTNQRANIYKSGFLLGQAPLSEARQSYLHPGAQSIEYRMFKKMIDPIILLVMLLVALIALYTIDDD